MPLTAMEWNQYRRKEAQKAYKYYQELGLDYGRGLSNPQIYEHIPTTFQCDLNHFSRVGNALGNADGGKWLCSEYFKPDDSCIIFSLGSNGDFSFENSMYEKTNGRCQIHTFDCTGTWVAPQYVQFHSWCLSGNDFTDEKGWIFKSWKTILNDLNIKKVDYLKMDIEGAEWSVMPAVLSQLEEDLPKQISFELHFFPESMGGRPKGMPKELLPEMYEGQYLMPTLKLFEMFDNRGYYVAAREDNLIGWNKCCQEFVMIRP